MNATQPAEINEKVFFFLMYFHSFTTCFKPVVDILEKRTRVSDSEICGLQNGREVGIKRSEHFT